ncbi:MAG: response regulator [Dysgonamonadaceae bacterium]|jgi:ligand-binding sensor domain-containing protein/signal transduction histidine kinase/DNA-binding response OmpR family regulator|nr:response regulator [Dysgonamonadaceae bacterium]
MSRVRTKVKYLILRIVFLLCLVFAPLFTASAVNYRFMHITGREGLPHQQVEALMQDDKGMLWIGTRNGLSRYDGYSIVSYFNQTDNPNSLSQNFVRKIFQDSKGRIWIGNYKGICMYRPATDDFQRYELSGSTITSILETSAGKIICGGDQLYAFDEETGEFVVYPRVDSDFIISMAIDRKDRLFIATNRSIFYYDASFSKITQINPAYFSSFITGYDGIIPLFFDSKGMFWIGRNGKGVMTINPENGIVKIYDAQQISDGTVRTISEDDKGRIWLGTEKGITILNLDGTTEIIRQDFVGKNKLNDNAIYTILCDRDGNIWIGTYFGGINVLLKNNEQFNWIEAGYGAKNIKGKAVRKMVELNKNILWIATEDGGLNIYNQATGDIDVFDRIPGLTHNVHELFYDDDGNEMWIGTYRNGLFRYNFQSGAWMQYVPDQGNGLPSDAIFAIEKQQNGTMWIGTIQGLRYYDPLKKSFLPISHPALDTDFIYCLLIDKEDNVWAGTRNNGLFRIDAQTHEVNGWTSKGSSPQLKDNYITSLYQENSSSRIWIGTNNGGLQYIDPADLAVKTLDNELSLSKTTICSAIEDEFGRLWISSSQGLYQFNRERNAFICYTVEDGLPVNQFNFSSSIQSQNGLLYFGSVNGLISFDPKAIKEERKFFHVHLSHLNIDNRNVTAKDADSPLTAALDDMSSIVFSYRQSRSFIIEYAAISLGNTSAINYQIRLPGMDEKWRNVGQERKFAGSNLPSGTYTLQIRANNSNEGWEQSPVKEIKIVIHPPFYLSLWAFLCYCIIFLVASYFSFRIFSIRLREKNAVRIANMEKEKMEEINKIKMDFFTSVSHELKTPLSLIIAPLKHIFQHQELSPESSERLETAIKNTNKMAGLINELVTFNKVESGNFQFYIQKGNPLDFIENVAKMFQGSASEKSISFYVHCENNGEDVWFSPSYLEIITSNLLSNAIKFTPQGGKIFINAAITDHPDGYACLRIEVKDTGIGIAAEELKNIFEKYYQTRRGHNVNNKGWGLGLALAKRLTDIHKGNISVESTIGEGSCFVVSLNVSESTFDLRNKINPDKTVVSLNQYEFAAPYLECSLPASIPVKNENTSSQASILLVEDNMELLKFLSDLFAPKYRVFLAKNGQEALDIARKYPIDLVISDVMMPEMDGNTLCFNLKNDISTSHIPVILLTAKNDADDILKGYKSGAEAYVQKPFDPQILELQVNNIIQMKQSQREKIADTLGSDVDSVALSKYDKEFISKINELIDKNIENDRFSISDITQTLGVSRSLLHVKMKSLLNISTGDYIRKKRLNKACELLSEGYNVSETTYQTGFADPNYFSKCFKKEFGVRPTDWQRKKKNS